MNRSTSKPGGLRPSLLQLATACACTEPLANIPKDNTASPIAMSLNA